MREYYARKNAFLQSPQVQKLKHWRAYAQADAGYCVPFLKRGTVHTQYALCNAPSFFVPQARSTCYFDWQLFNSEGELCGKGTLPLDPAGSMVFEPHKVVPGPLPEIGMFNAQIRIPALSDRVRLRHQSIVHSPFFMRVVDGNTGAHAVVHANATLNSARLNAEWRSISFIPTDDVNGIELLMINPTEQPFEATMRLESFGGQQLASKDFGIAPLGAASVTFAKDDFADTAFVRVASSALAAGNAKPVVLQWFGPDKFSGNHM